MGQLKMGILSDFRKKIGTVVGQRWRGGLYTTRAYVGKIRNPRTEKQQLHRARFSAMGKMGSAMRKILNQGYKQLIAGKPTTPIAEFVKLNLGACEATTPDSVTIDYSAISIADGSAPEVQFGSPLFDTPLTVEVSFTPNTDDPEADATDTVFLAVYNPEDGRSIMSEGAARSAASASVTVPGSWNGVKVHVWGFVVCKDEKRVSRSTYIGSGNIS